MAETSDAITDEQRRALREKYGRSETEIAAKNPALSGLGWIAAAGLLITIIAMLAIAFSPSPGTLSILFWPAMLTVGPTVAFLALVAYLATKAIIISRK